MDAPHTVRTQPPGWQGRDRSYTFLQVLEGSRATSLETTATVRSGGGLDLATRVLRGEQCASRIGVVVLLYDGCATPEWIYTSTPIAMTVLAAQPGYLVRQFEVPIDIAALQSARHIAVKHYLARTDPWDDIKGWLGKAEAPGSGFSTVQGLTHELS